jgi:DNA-binding transcriptional regulator YdaS (Cro superfamily)
VKNLIILGGLAVAGAYALVKTEKGQELLAVVEEKLDEKIKEADERNSESAAKIEAAIREAAERAAQRLGINLDELRRQANAANEPEESQETGGLGG